MNDTYVHACVCVWVIVCTGACMYLVVEQNVFLWVMV